MLNPRTRIFMLLLGLAVLFFVINLVRTRRLQERYALLWLVAGLGLTAAPLLITWLDRLAYALGFEYPPALLLMLAVIGLLLIIFQLSLSISHSAEQLKVLTQEVGLLRQEAAALSGWAAASSASRRSGDGPEAGAQVEVLARQLEPGPLMAPAPLLSAEPSPQTTEEDQP